MELLNQNYLELSTIMFHVKLMHPKVGTWGRLFQLE